MFSFAFPVLSVRLCTAVFMGVSSLLWFHIVCVSLRPVSRSLSCVLFVQSLQCLNTCVLGSFFSNKAIVKFSLAWVLHLGPVCLLHTASYHDRRLWRRERKEEKNPLDPDMSTKVKCLKILMHRTCETSLCFSPSPCSLGFHVQLHKLCGE